MLYRSEVTPKGRTRAMDLSALPITHRAVIPESYIDSMGHMNVMWYTHLFALATGGLFRRVGLDRAYFQSNQAGTFALKQLFTYLVEVRVGEEVTIRTRVLGRSAKRLHVMHFMTKGVPEVLTTTSEFIGAHIDMTTRRTSPFPESIAGAIDRLLAENSALDWAPPVSGAMAP
jgi:acyl-CoA thioester hydrolase